MSDFKKTVADFRYNGIKHKAFINEKGEMIIRYNENGENYTEDVFDGIGRLIQVVDVQDGSKYVWPEVV